MCSKVKHRLLSRMAIHGGPIAEDPGRGSNEEEPQGHDCEVTRWMITSNWAGEESGMKNRS